ncbi:MAG: DUF423 domain-containing protein [Phototrophicales bacterium]|nr:MAG: DUF423 domain-containing protein [Phototrophicales bacterium]RMG73868.1 MAG: DUF423 domain-containing protein [Chloroflexota bacterium]
MSRYFILIAAGFGFIGVALGAFGAHGLAATLEANGRVDTFETAAKYQMYHALAMLGIAWLSTQYTSNWIKRAGYFITTGTVIFCGSLYILAITNLGFMGAIAPIGGVFLLAGWAAIAIGVWGK